MTLETYVTNLVRKIEPELKCSFEKTGSAYNSKKNIINFDFSIKDDYGFLNHLEEFHNCKFTRHFHLNFWTILHEIGHYETENEIDTKKDWGDRLALYCTNEITPEIRNAYFNLSWEFAATEWAIDWIHTNWNEAYMINKLIEKFSQK